jgi:hypothetical protein
MTSMLMTLSLRGKQHTRQTCPELSQLSQVLSIRNEYNEIGKSWYDCRWQRLCKEGCKIASGAPNPLAHCDMKIRNEVYGIRNKVHDMACSLDAVHVTGLLAVSCLSHEPTVCCLVTFK